MSDKQIGVSLFAPYNPEGVNESSQATIMHSGLRKRTPVASCVGTKALQLTERPQALIFGLLDRVATESAAGAMVIYPAITTNTLNQRITSPVDVGKPGDLVTISVINSAGLQPQDLLTVAPFGEQFWVKAVPSSKQVDVQRVGNMPSVPLAKGTTLMHTGNAVAEGSMRRLGHYSFEASYISSSNIVRNGWSQTGTMSALRSKEGNANLVNSYDRPGMIMAHARDNNQVILYGQSFKSMENGLPFTMGDGVISAVRLCAPQNVINIAAPVSLKTFARLIQKLRRVPVEGIGDTLQVYCDYTSYEAWQEIGKAENGIQINSGTNNIGLVYSEFVVGGTTIEVIYDQGMDENAAAEGISSGFMFFFNPASVVIDYLPGRRGLTASYKGMDAKENADFNSADITAESILSEFHILHKAPNANGIITGFNCDMVKREALLTLDTSKQESYFKDICTPEEVG